GLQGKYVGKRFATDINDEVSPSYTVFDADLRYDLSKLGLGHSFIQFNIVNLFDKHYLAGITTTRNNATTIVVPVVGAPIIPPATTAPTATITGLPAAYSIGAPRTYQVSLRAAF